MTPTTGLLDTKEAASRLGLAAETLEKWRSQKSHKLRFIKCGGRVFYRQEFLDEFLAANVHNGDGSQARPRRRRRQR